MSKDKRHIFYVDTTSGELFIKATSCEEAETKAIKHIGMSGTVIGSRVATEKDLSYAREVGLV